MKQKFHYIIGLVTLVVFMFISVIAFYVHKDTESKLNNQFAKTELIMAKFVAHELKSGIERLISELESIAVNPDAINMDIYNIPFFVKNNMNEVMHSGLIHNIVFVTKDDNIIYSYPTGQNIYKLSSEYDLSILKKYKEALEDGKAILSDTYDLKDKRKKAASIFVPIRSPDIEYKGSIGVLVDVNKLRMNFITPIATLRAYNLLINDESGSVMDAVCKDYGGFICYGNCENSGCLADMYGSSIAKLNKEVSEKKEAVTSFFIDINQQYSKKPITLKKFAAFTTFTLANREFSLILSVPYEMVTFLVQKNFQYILLILGTTLLFILFLAYLLFEINKKRIEAEEAEKHLRTENNLKKELTLSEEKYKMVMDEALEGIAIFRGVEIIEVNNAWAEMFETTVEKCIGMSIYDLIHHDSIDEMKNYFTGKESFTDKAPIHYDISVTTRKGRKRIHNISVCKLGTHENVICMVSRDVTEKRYEEFEIQRSKEQLEKANKELDFYINSIVHDIKNPLATARGFVNIIVNEYCTKEDEEKDNYVSRIYSNISHIFDLLNSLLELSKIGRMKKHLERIDVKREIGVIKGYLSSIIDDKSAQIVISTPLPIIYTDRTLITQVFENLISNAIKFSKDDVPPVIEIGSSDRGDYVEFYVKDNGIGVEKKHYRTILKVFGRVNENMQGSGVGLNVVSKAVEELGGSLNFESEIDKGSKFTFTIPKKDKFFYLKDLKSIV